MGRHSWDGDEHDYWDFEDDFYKDDKELAEQEEKRHKELEIKELKARIEADSKKLAELEQSYNLHFKVKISEEIVKLR